MQQLIAARGDHHLVQGDRAAGPSAWTRAAAAFPGVEDLPASCRIAARHLRPSGSDKRSARTSRTDSRGSVSPSTKPAANEIRSGFSSARAISWLIGCPAAQRARWLRILPVDGADATSEEQTCISLRSFEELRSCLTASAESCRRGTRRGVAKNETADPNRRLPQPSGRAPSDEGTHPRSRRSLRRPLCCRLS